MYGAAGRDRGQAANQPPDAGMLTVRYDDFGGYAPGGGPWLLRDVKRSTTVDERPPRVFDLRRSG